MRRSGVAAVVFAASIGCGNGTSSPASPDSGQTSELDSGADATAETGPRALCVDGKSVDETYPKAAYEISPSGTLPDLSFDGVDATGAPTKVSLHDFYEPCAARSRLLLLRVVAGWSGTCRWDGAHTKDLLALDIASRLQLVDVLVANDDNVPSASTDIASWRARLDTSIPIVVDPKYQLSTAGLGRVPLPLYVVVDTRRMEVRTALDNPDSDYLANWLRQELAQLDHAPMPPNDMPAPVDGFTRKQWDLLRDMKAPDAPPPDPTNAKADDPQAAKLGEQLFADTSLSPSGTVSCATCHDRTKGFADGMPRATGVATGDRNAPAVTLASHNRWQFWDGRADTLWAQALGPFENEKEFASSRLFVVHAIFTKYKAAYEAIFGALPPLDDTTRFPAAGKPGDAVWAAMSDADRTAVTRVYVNAGKSIAAFERTLRIGTNALDAYIAGDKGALTAAEKNGLSLFFSAGCIQCHYGPRLTDDAFHVVRFPTGRADGKADVGRSDGIATLLASEFRADGPFSDDKSAAHGLAGLVAGAWTTGAFKTPTLRGVTLTSPYGHGGSLATLTDVLKNYSTAGLKIDDPLAVGTSEPWLPQFVPGHVDELLPFMNVLGGTPR